MATLRQTLRNNPFYAKQMFRLQVFLLRHNLAKRLGGIAMVITTTGRTTGKQRSTPIGYLRQSDGVLAFTYPHHHWYKNLRKKPEALLTIRGERIPVRADILEDAAERRRFVETYQRERPGMFARMYKLAPGASVDEILQAAKDRVFVRFRPKAAS
jgi:deazaflavin-dependent oxidoreductase (nitroreductase family)